MDLILDSTKCILYLWIYHQSCNKFCTPFQFSPALYLILRTTVQTLLNILRGSCGESLVWPSTNKNTHFSLLSL